MPTPVLSSDDQQIKDLEAQLEQIRLACIRIRAGCEALQQRLDVNNILIVKDQTVVNTSVSPQSANNLQSLRPR